MRKPEKYRSSKRPFGFESLESKTSPTASVLSGGLVEVDSARTAEVANAESVADAVTAQRFLQYVAMLEEHSIERSLPDSADVAAVDTFITETSPWSTDVDYD